MIAAMQTDHLAQHLDHLFDVGRFRDYCHNGIQVGNSGRCQRIATATTASQLMIDQAVAAEADALLVHHGLIWGKLLQVTGIIRNRLAALLAADCALLAYHLPLDAHRTIGNNAVVLEALGVGEWLPFAEHQGQAIGWCADLYTPICVEGLRARCQKLFKHPVQLCPGIGDRIERVGVVTGGGQSHLLDAAAVGCQAFITGEASEQSWHEAMESGCHMLACGHHASEAIAVHRLGQQLAAEFGLEHIVLRQDNPI
jgi:dinuclear metal center YbgI/SA1388 family protein